MRKLSAKLKLGQYFKLKKSITESVQKRFIRFPRPPAKIKTRLSFVMFFEISQNFKITVARIVISNGDKIIMTAFGIGMLNATPGLKLSANLKTPGKISSGFVRYVFASHFVPISSAIKTKNNAIQNARLLKSFFIVRLQ